MRKLRNKFWRWWNCTAEREAWYAREAVLLKQVWSLREHHTLLDVEIVRLHAEISKLNSYIDAHNIRRQKWHLPPGPDINQPSTWHEKSIYPSCDLPPGRVTLPEK